MRKNSKKFNWYELKKTFSIRKFHFGAASVLLGTSLLLGTTVLADTTANTTANIAASTTANTAASTTASTTANTAASTAASTTASTTANTAASTTANTAASTTANTSAVTPTINDIKSDNVVVNSKFYDSYNGWKWKSWGDQSTSKIENAWGEIRTGSNGNILMDHGKSIPSGSWTWVLPDPFPGLKKWESGDSVYQDIALPDNRTLTKFEFSAESSNSLQMVKDENGNSVVYADGSGIRVTFTDASGNILSSYETGPSSSGGMRTLALSNNIPNGATNAQIELLGYAAYPHWIDAYWSNVQFYYYSHDTIVTNTETKNTTLTVRYHGAGEKTPKDNNQIVTWTRTVIINKTTGEIVSSSDWIKSKSVYDTVITPAIEGYSYDKDKVSELVKDYDLVDDVYYTPLPTKSTTIKPVRLIRKTIQTSKLPVTGTQTVKSSIANLPETGDNSTKSFIATIIGFAMILLSIIASWKLDNRQK